MSEWRWLESTEKLQRETYGIDARKHSLEESIDVVKDMFIAAVVELVEMLNESKWKYWTHEAPWIRRELMFKEIIDVQHMIGNILNELGYTDDEYEKAYQAKQEENRRRQREGYTTRGAPVDTQR